MQLLVSATILVRWELFASVVSSLQSASDLWIKLPRDKSVSQLVCGASHLRSPLFKVVVLIPLVTYSIFMKVINGPGIA